MKKRRGRNELRGENLREFQSGLTSVEFCHVQIEPSHSSAWRQGEVVVHGRGARTLFKTLLLGLQCNADMISCTTHSDSESTNVVVH